MGFNFGAFLGGAASQIVEDINEQEKEVKLRTRTILDRQVAQTAANQKEYKENKKKVTEQLSALTNLFGNTPEGIAKARAIVAGGDTHFNYMFTKLTSHAENKGDVNKLYQLTPNADAVGFKNVEEATGSLVKMAGLPDVKLGTSGFGANYFKKAQQQYIDAGLIQTAVTDKADVTNYATGKLDLSLLKTKTKSMQEQRDEAWSMAQKAKPGSPEHKELMAKYNKVNEAIIGQSVALKVAQTEAQTKLTEGQKYNEIKDSYFKGYKNTTSDFLVDGKVYNEKGNLLVKDEGVKFLAKKRAKYNTQFVANQIDSDGNFSSSNVEKFIKDNPDLSKIADKVIAAIKQTKEPQVSEEEKVKMVKEKYPEPSGFATTQLNKLYKKGKPSDKQMQNLFVQIQKIYQVDQDTARKILQQAIENKPKEPDYGTFKTTDNNQETETKNNEPQKGNKIPASMGTTTTDGVSGYRRWG